MGRRYRGDLALLLVVLGWAAPEMGLVSYVVQQYYHGNELLFLAGLLSGIDAERTKDVVVER